MAGLVMLNLRHGNYSFTLVDDDLWNQITALKVSENKDYPGQGLDQFSDIVMWLSSNNPDDIDDEDYYPEPKGKVIKTIVTEDYIINPG